MRGSDEAAGRRGGSPTTMRALTVSALVNVAVVALVLSGRGSGRARIQLRPHVLLSQEPHSVATMEGKIRRAAEAAEGDLGREARQRQKRRAAAAKKAVGAGETEGWPRGEFGMRLDHPTQKLSGVHAEIQFNAGHASFGEGALVPKLRNETEEQMQEAAAPEPTPAPEPATQDAMQYGGTYCSASYVVSGVGVPHPWEDTVPKPLNQVSVEAWVKDCSMSAVRLFLHLLQLHPRRAERLSHPAAVGELSSPRLLGFCPSRLAGNAAVGRGACRSTDTSGLLTTRMIQMHQGQVNEPSRLMGGKWCGPCRICGVCEDE
jgi:hypothetical protein